LVTLMSAVVLQQQPTVRAAFRKGVGNITVSDQAVYDKLNGLELKVSEALVRDSAARLEPVLAAFHTKNAAWLKGYRVRILDGNALAATQRRVRPLRAARGAPLPGRALVVLDPHTELATHAFLIPDGHDQERTRLDEVLPLVQKRQLWIADRNFCTLKFLFGIDRAQAAFVIRQHGCLVGAPAGRRKRVGRSDTGAVYEQRLSVAHEGHELEVRRVTVILDQPTQDGDHEIHILTNLPARVAGAVVVADLYQKRWTIEGRFLEMAQAFNAEPNTLGYPPAALFAFCLGLVASNALALLRGAVRAEHGTKDAAALSSYDVALDIQQLHRGMMVALPASEWQCFATLTAPELASVLRRMAQFVDVDRYRKTTRGPKKKPVRKVYNSGGHVSTHRLLQKQRK
jgi:hypothetical protein